MIKFDKPINLNGTEILAELNAANIKITEPPTVDGNNDLWLNIHSKDEIKAKPIVAAHNGTIVPPDKTAARQAILDRLGITADEAAILLG
jgi:sulfur carrier protein ThiS